MLASTASCESFEKAKITRSTPCSSDAFAQARGPAEKERQPFREVVVEGRGPIVDEPDELDAVLTMVQELQRKLLSDGARPDDHRILGIAGEMAAQCARDGAQRRDQEDREEPEDAEPAEHRLDEMRCHTEQREHPYADGDAAEHADDVVDRRVIGPLLVSVVEALEPEQEDPEREGQEQGQVLHPGADPVCRRARVGHEQACEHERQNEARDIREQQRTADELAAPIPSPLGRLLDRQLERANQIYREVVADTPAFNSKALAHPSPFPTSPRGCRPPPFPSLPLLPLTLAADDGPPRAPTILVRAEMASAPAIRGVRTRGRLSVAVRHRSRFSRLFASSQARRVCDGSVSADRSMLSTVSSATTLNLGWSHAPSVPAIRSLVWTAV